MNGGPHIHLISDFDGLVAAAAGISRHEAFGIDTEFDRNRNRYGFNLCVVQIAAGSDVYIIDPLAICPDRTRLAERLEPLWQLVRSPGHLKIMHACSEDIRLFDKFGARPVSVFDTQVAARMLCLPATGFGDLLRHELGVELNKKLQTSNWFKRPLDNDRMAYLAGDVQYLPELRSRLHAALADSGRISWFEEEMRTILDFEPVENYDADITPFVRRREYWELTPEGRFLARTLWNLRDDTARQRDVPPFYVLADSLIYQLASRSSRLLPGQLPRLSPYMPEKRLIAVFNDAFDRTESGHFHLPPDNRVRPPRPGPNRVSNEEALVLFQPVVERLTADHGPEAARLLLSEAAIKRVAFAGSVDVLPGYAARIMRELSAGIPGIQRFC